MIVGWCFFCEITGVGSDEFPLGKAYFEGLCWFYVQTVGSIPPIFLSPFGTGKSREFLKETPRIHN